jgi:hypothetical protein
MMSIYEQKSLPLSIWTWDDPGLPLGSLRAKWIDGVPLAPDEETAVRHNQERNPDIRIREECRVLLLAASPAQCTSGAADSLRRRAMGARLRKMIVPLTPA